MIEWLIKKVVCGKINGLLEKYSQNVDSAKASLKTWIERLKKILTCFESLLAKLDDNKLEPSEVKDASDQIMALVKGF